jgi:hypothetical protein
MFAARRPQDQEILEIREMSGKLWNCQGILKYVRETLYAATSHYCTYHLMYLISRFQCTYSNVLTYLLLQTNMMNLKPCELWTISTLYVNQLTKRIISSKTVCFLCEILNKRLESQGKKRKICQGNHRNVREFKNFVFVATLIVINAIYCPQDLLCAASFHKVCKLVILKMVPR